MVEPTRDTGTLADAWVVHPAATTPTVSVTPRRVGGTATGPRSRKAR